MVSKAVISRRIDAQGEGLKRVRISSVCSQRRTTCFSKISGQSGISASPKGRNTNFCFQFETNKVAFGSLCFYWSTDVIPSSDDLDEPWRVYPKGMLPGAEKFAQLRRSFFKIHH
jgi:hypothetical protein